MSGGTTSTRSALHDRRSARRVELLDDAVACVRQEGPFVTMEQLATACGVTKPILYRHFGDRDGLVTAMAERFVDDLQGALAPSMSDRDAATRDLLARTIDAYLALVERDTHLYRFLTSQTGSDRRDLVASIVAELTSVVIERRLDAAGADTAPARPWAYGLVGMVHLTGDWWVDHPGVIDRAQLVDQLMTLVWDGLGHLGLDTPSPDQPQEQTP